MRLNRFSIHRACRYQNHIIRVEKRSLFFTMEYSLIIDGQKQDQLMGTYGVFVLHGAINGEAQKEIVEIIVHQGLISVRFFCRIGTVTIPMDFFDPRNSE